MLTVSNKLYGLLKEEVSEYLNYNPKLVHFCPDDGSGIFFRNIDSHQIIRCHKP